MSLPGVYERWFTELAGEGGPTETRATCHACVMLPGAPNLPPEGPFSPELLCCTYHPQLPAYLVGGILKDGTALGKAKILARIAGQEGVTPIGIIPTLAYSADHARLAALPGSFGHREELRCPFLEEHRCSIWQHRGVACAAFHCKYDRGVFSQWRWNMIVVAFNAVDRALTTWLLARLGLSAAACDALLHDPSNEERRALAWGNYLGREADYFLEAAALVEPLTWDEIATIGGQGLSMMATSFRRALAHMNDVPATVKRGHDVLVQIGPTREARVQNRLVPLDVLEVPADVMAIVEGLGAEGMDTHALGLQMPADMVRRLLDWQLLVTG